MNSKLVLTDMKPIMNKINTKFDEIINKRILCNTTLTSK